MGLFVTYKSTTASRVEGSHPGRSSFFCVNVPAANCSEEKLAAPSCRERRKAGAGAATKDEGRRTGRRIRNGFTRTEKEGSKTAKIT